MRTSVKYAAGLLIILLCTVLVGCNGNNEIPGHNNQPPEQSESVPIDNEESNDLLTDSGAFAGRIDDLSIEIHISGVPDDNGYRAFELSEQLRKDFDSYGFESGDQVRFKYQPGPEGQRGVIMEITRIVN